MALTDDEMMDINPQLARGNDGALWLAWVSSPGNSLTGNTTHPNRLLATRWNSRQWSPLETTPAELAGTLTWRLAAFDAERALIAAGLDTDGSLASAADREIIAIERGKAGWHAATPISANSSLEGEPLLAWANGTHLMGIAGNLQTTPLAQALTPVRNSPPDSLIREVQS
ncbi:MAG: hypothetical protein ACOYYS_14210 [Chloroflexota bacterium]